MAPTTTVASSSSLGAVPNATQALAERKAREAAKAQNLIDEYQDFFYASRHSQADSTYAHSDLLPTYPEDPQPPLDGNTPVDDRAAYSKAKGGWEKGTLVQRAQVEEIIPTIGTELRGIDLRTLSGAEKDDLALLLAERGVVVVRDQHKMTMEEQLDLGRWFGKLHMHATTGRPAAPEFAEVHVVYTDSKKRPPSSAFSKLDLWHSDVTYELQPPGVTSLRILESPKSGGDTLFASGYALYDSLSPGMQKYLEGLSAVHSAFEQAEGNKRAGQFVRREPVESVHPVVRVNPVTGWKSVFVNPGFTRYIVGIPKAESEFLLNFLYTQMATSFEIQVRAKWYPGTIVFWDNRVVTHSATFDFFPSKRHAVRVTATAERPLSVDDASAGGIDPGRREDEIYKRLGIYDLVNGSGKVKDAGGAKGYND